jgi:hypothetical protein
MVYASGMTYPSRAVGVTVADLLTAIHNHLHSQSVSATDINKLQPKQHTRLLEANEKRRKMSRGADQGIKLVDTFLLHTLFAGLEVDPENAYTINLSVKRPN